MFVRMFSTALVAALIAGSAGATVLQIKTRSPRGYLPRGWSVRFWELDVKGTRVSVVTEHEADPCPQASCWKRRRHRLPGNVYVEGNAIRYQASNGRTFTVAHRRSGAPASSWTVAPGVDLRNDRGGTYLLVDSEVTGPNLD